MPARVLGGRKNDDVTVTPALAVSRLRRVRLATVVHVQATTRQDDRRMREAGRPATVIVVDHHVDLRPAPPAPPAELGGGDLAPRHPGGEQLQ